MAGTQQQSGPQSIEQISTTLQNAFNLDIDQMLSSNPSQKHNLQEEWNSTVGKVREFYNKYGQSKQ